MATRIITKSIAALQRASWAMPRWVWCVALWCVGVSGAMLVGALFKVFMNVTLFAVSK
ncbi:hypothetical protein [Trinickia mobilis]|uniref:hypothetical protein n=1 Tax=Trinickia mobilis TaxID=2816356 RepID=UPI001A8F8768|nr:hypothetical protein [Trinickia mobilis]